jgi:cation diffusion facilitator CzcD-associated flavoprotein CzcO
MIEARWDDASGLWRVSLADGSTVTGRYLIAGLGPLSRPRFPDIPGRERFKGPAFHSSEWRHDVDLAGKRVAVIGTGASAIQFVPQIAPKVAALHLFQRTPAWILPKRDREFGPLERALIRWAPGWRAGLRAWIYGLLEIRALAFTVDQRMLKKPEKMALDHLAAQVRDPELRAKLTPDYALGCKRVLISNDFYPTLGRSNVTLTTDPIAEIDEEAVVLADGGRIEADVLIYGTGFRPSEPWSPLRVVGRGGVELSDVWKGGMEAYYGAMVAGFPNLFVLLGPNSGLGHNSVVIMIEAQVERFLRCLKLVDRGVVERIEVRKDVQDRFNDELQERMKRTVWASGCASWYLDARGRNVTVWPGFSFDFVRQAKAVDPADLVAA